MKFSQWLEVTRWKQEGWIKPPTDFTSDNFISFVKNKYSDKYNFITFKNIPKIGLNPGKGDMGVHRGTPIGIFGFPIISDDRYWWRNKPYAFVFRPKNNTRLLEIKENNGVEASIYRSIWKKAEKEEEKRAKRMLWKAPVHVQVHAPAIATKKFLELDYDGIIDWNTKTISFEPSQGVFLENKLLILLIFLKTNLKNH